VTDLLLVEVRNLVAAAAAAAAVDLVETYT
jgi:hypothetical protein